MNTRFAQVRAHTQSLVALLSDEDCQAQSMPDASPAKWHLAHTAWFFETFVLERFEPGFAPFDAAFRVLFNSYYNAVGHKHPRPERGLLTRPSLARVQAYRARVDQRMTELLRQLPSPELQARVELGLQHEQQHQELLLTDVLHLLSCNPTHPVYSDDAVAPRAVPAAQPLRWIEADGGAVDIGHRGDGFAFDNECPRHTVLLRPHALASSLVTQRQWLRLIDAGGYCDPRCWLSSGWDWVQANGITVPLYWQRDGDTWSGFSLQGLQPLRADEPVVHISCYEADAFAHWCSDNDPSMRGARLPTEAEWEHAAALAANDGSAGLEQLYGQAWQWSASPYTAYPDFRPWAGAVGEYNGKFMINQQVLRGSSLATPDGHSRSSYRNFFPARIDTGPHFRRRAAGAICRPEPGCRDSRQRWHAHETHVSG